MNSLTKTYHSVILGLLVIFLALPIIATLIYSISTNWGASILPSGYTLDAFIELFQDARFYHALGRSLFVCICALVLAIVLILPATITVHYFFPKMKNLMNLTVILPFAVPPVVSSVGLLNLYSDGFLEITGTPWILISCYFVISLPFIYRLLDNNLQSINIRDLIDTAQLLGASKKKAVFYIIIPNLAGSLVISLLLGLSFLLGEFVYANILVGGSYETLQVFLFSLRSYSGHYSSAVVISYFVILLLFSLISLNLGRKRSTWTT